MENLQVHLGSTSISISDRFALIGKISPIQTARTRRLSTNDGPLFSSELRGVIGTQVDVDEVVQQLGLDWRVKELMQENYSRASSRPPSRCETDMPGLVHSNNWGNISRASSVSNVSQSERFNRELSEHSLEISLQMNPAMQERMQRRDVWMRARRMRGRGRGRIGYLQRGRKTHHNWQPYRRHPYGGRQWGRQWGRQNQRGHQWVRQQQRGWGRPQRRGYPQSERAPLTPHGRAGLKNPKVANRGPVNRGGCIGRSGQPRGISQNSMPALKSREELDKELDEYMDIARALLAKKHGEYKSEQAMDSD